MIIIQKNQKRKIGNFKEASWEFRNVKKVFRSRGFRGSPSNYEYTAKAYWEDTGEFAGNFNMSAKNLKGLKQNIKLESDWVHIQLKKSKERMKKSKK